MLSMLSMAWAALPVPLKTKYAAMLAAKLEQHGTHVWLVNTGWSAGGYGVGRRISLEHTRAIVAAIHSGELAAAERQTLPLFNLQAPTSCPGVPPELLLPSTTWVDKEAYSQQLVQLAALFVANFKKFEGGSRHMSEEEVRRIVEAGPSL